VWFIANDNVKTSKALSIKTTPVHVISATSLYGNQLHMVGLLTTKLSITKQKAH